MGTKYSIVDITGDYRYLKTLAGTKDDVAK